MTYTYLLFLIPLISSLICTPFVRKISTYLNIVDSINGDFLKIHKKDMPLLGGGVLLISIVAGAFFEYLVIPERLNLNFFSIIVLFSLVIFCLGLKDDINTLKPKIRFIIQMIIGFLCYFLGFKILFIAIVPISLFFTIFYIVGSINSFNIIDGMDGLCVGISIISCIGFYFLGIRTDNFLLSSLARILFFSLLGFLPFNFHPAKIFLGDCGSYLIGFLLGFMCVIATNKPYNVIHFIVPILIVGFPIIDMMVTIFRRLKRKKLIFCGDRDHLYDLLLKKGWKQQKVWMYLCGFHLAIVICALLLLRI